MRALSGSDAAFIYLESDHCPMHVGGVYLFDAAEAPASFAFEKIRSEVERRLPRSRVFRERLVATPFDLSHPHWINDPSFDLAGHLHALTLPRPGGTRQLMQTAAGIFGHALDRSRPLWDMYFVDGLDAVPGLAPGSFALIVRTHQAALDGGFGAEPAGILLDESPDPGTAYRPDDWQPEVPPGVASAVAKAHAKLGRKSVDFGKFVGDVAAGTTRMYGARRVRRLKPPPLPFSAPRTVLNGAVSSSRTFWAVDLPFGRFRRIGKTVPSASVNDVILAVCAGGLRRYLLEKEALPRAPLVAMAPVTVAGRTRYGSPANRVSSALVSLETNVADPLQRLLRISRNTQNSRVHADALPAAKLTEFIPSETAAAAARLYTRTRLGGRHRPFFNLTISNVPGPPGPLYLAGAPLRQMYGTAPILDGLGLVIAVFSYAGRVSLSLTSCLGVVPDPGGLAGCLEPALAELEDAVEQAGDFDAFAAVPAHEPRSEAEETLAAFHEASRSLDKAIEILERYADP